MIKTSIRFFEDIPVRAVWDDDTSKWWFCAMDIAEALTKSSNPRVYWATMKRRNTQLIAICKQLKLKEKKLELAQNASKQQKKQTNTLHIYACITRVFALVFYCLSVFF